MTKEDVIQMAREAGFWKEHTNTWMCTGEDIARFAALVAAAEREACATFLERVVDLSHLNTRRVWQKYTADLLANCAAGIRARKNT